jgi:L-ascorbate metabolism protein UlaG (beta-lactamase superfamily)
MKLTYWGHACFLIETGSHRIVIDPYLTGNPKAAVKADDVVCDYVVVTHGHNDHVGDAVAIARRNDATVVGVYEVVTFLAGKGAKVHPMQIGGARQFPFGRVKLTIAHHGSAYEENGQMRYMGNPAGALITAEGKTVYHAGDTGLFLDMQLIGEQNPIDVALLPIGDNFTMGIDDAAKATEFLKPKLAIPMHYGTFDLIDVDPNEFAQKARRPGVNVQILAPGESCEVT